jgi:2-isopropylmalate synthase
VTPGEDALGAVLVRVKVDGRTYTGQGVATDIVESSIKAYLAALNRAAVGAELATASTARAEGVV